jgi:hypothetical protein
VEEVIFVLAGPVLDVIFAPLGASICIYPAPFSHGKECSRDYVIATAEFSKTKSRLPGRDFVKLATGEAV